jgi:hypothetical protein
MIRIHRIFITLGCLSLIWGAINPLFRWKFLLSSGILLLTGSILWLRFIEKEELKEENTRREII